MANNPKRTVAIELLVAKGIWPANYVPMGLRLLWWVGIDVPPPIFMGFWSNFVSTGCVFAAGYFFANWMLKTAINRTTMRAIIFNAGAGLIFGLYVAKRNANLRQKHNLPSWDELIQ